MISKKICLLGDFAVGKSSLVTRFVQQTFSEKYLTTVGVKVDTKVVELNNNTTLKLVIWDIAGNDEFSHLDTNYLKGSAGIFLVADLTRKETIGSVIGLRETALDILSDIPMACALNKRDLESKCEINDTDIQALKSKGVHVFHTSAKTGDNVEGAFQHLARLLAIE